MRAGGRWLNGFHINGVPMNKIWFENNWELCEEWEDFSQKSFFLIFVGKETVLCVAQYMCIICENIPGSTNIFDNSNGLQRTTRGLCLPLNYSIT